VTEMRRIGEGREADIFDAGDGLVIKLFRLGSTDSCEREWRALHALPSELAPKAIKRIEMENRVGFVMERVIGADVLSVLGSAPWRLSSLGLLLGQTHAAVHDVVASESLPTLREVIHARLSTSSALEPRHRDTALAALDHLPDGVSVCHGDFHPGNVLISKQGVRVLDWPNATVGDPHADVAASDLILRLAEPSESSPWAVRRLNRVGRTLLARRYLAGYRSRRALDSSLVNRWAFVVAADRATHGIPQERGRLLAEMGSRL
jgi:aminoglycoside phosphotransferase (APT) family kinase protein